MQFFECPKTSHLQSVSYENGTLTVHFKSDNIYEYYGVPEQMFHLFFSASSKGSFIHKHIIGKFPERKIR